MHGWVKAGCVVQLAGATAFKLGLQVMGSSAHVDSNRRVVHEGSRDVWQGGGTKALVPVTGGRRVLVVL
jgi:hypothetical protein